MQKIKIADFREIFVKSALLNSHCTNTSVIRQFEQHCLDIYTEFYALSTTSQRFKGYRYNSGIIHFA